MSYQYEEGATILNMFNNVRIFLSSGKKNQSCPNWNLEIGSIFKNNTLKIILIASVGLQMALISSKSFAQVPTSSDTIVSLALDNELVGFDALSRKNINDLNIPQKDFQKILSGAQKFQTYRNEALGVELGLDNSDRIILKPRNDLKANQLAIDNGDLISIFEKAKIQADINQNSTLETYILNELESSMGDFGANLSRYTNILGNRIQRTIKPISPELPVNTIPVLESLNCSNGIGACSNSMTNINGRLIASVVRADSTDNTSYKSCADAQLKFRENVEKNPDVRSSWPNWRGVSDALSSAIEFENECLTPLTNTTGSIGSNLAVLKMPNDPEPFCSGFRISSNKVITAMHCFIDENSGRKFKKKLKKAEVFLASDPTTPLSLPADIKDAIHERKYNTVLARQVPAYQDFLVITIDDTNIKTFAFPELRIGELTVGETVSIPGYFIYHSQSYTSPGQWPKFVNSTKPIGFNYCRIYDIAEDNNGNGCLAHSCQALPGYSGSPILQTTTLGEVSLVGLHLRASKDYGHHCPANFAVAKEIGLDPSEPITKFSNLGVRLTEELLTAKGWKAKEMP